MIYVGIDRFSVCVGTSRYQPYDIAYFVTADGSTARLNIPGCRRYASVRADVVASGVVQFAGGAKVVALLVVIECSFGALGEGVGLGCARLCHFVS